MERGVVKLSGRFDATQEERAREFFEGLISHWETNLAAEGPPNEEPVQVRPERFWHRLIRLLFGRHSGPSNADAEPATPTASDGPPPLPIEGPLVCDLSELRYISSAGLGLFCAFKQRLLNSGSDFKLKNLNPHLREVFEIAGFDRIFDID